MGIDKGECGGFVVGFLGEVVGVNIVCVGWVKIYVLLIFVLILVIEKLKMGEFFFEVVNKNCIDKFNIDIVVF